MKNIYKRHRFPPSILQYAVWLNYRFNLSIRDVEDLLAERDISVGALLTGASLIPAEVSTGYDILQELSWLFSPLLGQHLPHSQQAVFFLNDVVRPEVKGTDIKP